MTYPTVSRHALTQIEKRFGVSCGTPEVHRYLAVSRTMFTSPNGAYMLAPIGAMSLGVLVVKNKAVVTAVTLDMAFSDCPMAVFLILAEEGYLTKALGLRVAYISKRLPPSKGSDHRFQKRRAEIVWGVFNKSCR